MTADASQLPVPGHPEPEPVTAMFGAIASRYELLNLVLSLGQDRRWRRRAAQLTRLRLGDSALDLCCGTGQLAAQLHRRVAPGGRVVGVDLTPEMLEAGRRRAPQIDFVQADATRLPFADASFDAATVAFGIRNVLAPGSALREMYRTLRPGGRVVVLEFSTVAAPMAPLYGWYSRHVIPFISHRLAGRDAAYRYLTASIRAFPPPEVVSGWLAEAGFERVSYQRMSWGIVALHVGRRPRG